MRYALLALRLAVGGVFVYAAWTKLKQPWLLFALSIDSYQLLPEWAVLAAARTIPWLELALGALLIAAVRLRWTASAAAGLLLVFLAILIRAYALGLGIDCGCFGVGEALTGWTLARDSVLAILAAGLAVSAWRPLRPAGTGASGLCDNN